MHVSVIFATHNEGAALARSIEGVIETCANLDYEIILVDDASTDGSVENVALRFPHITVKRNAQRLGASPAKAAGGHAARGEVLVFLDGHTKPEVGAIPRLVRDIDLLEDRAIVTPTVAPLDVSRWSIDLSRAGHGYSLDLRTFQSGWVPLEDLRTVSEAPGRLYESPALIGCALAVKRELYDRLWGFDTNMKFWGVEDIDLGLRCWLMGHSILHDHEAVVGHKFRSGFDNYSVPIEWVVCNQVRMAWKVFTHGVWAEWLTACRQRNPGGLVDHPEGVWARAWHLFEQERPSADQERSYLHGRRVRDEFWYAERFGLAWPSLQPPAPREQLTEFFPAASPSPSPRPPVCVITGIAPAVVAIPVGVVQRFSAQGRALSSARWSTSPPGTPATGLGASFASKWTASGTKRVTVACGSTSRTATVKVVSIAGVLTPRDNFAGRSLTRFGIGEVIDLSFTASPPASAAELGGLRWFVSSGGGTIVGGTDGRGRYTAPPTGGAVTLVLKVVSGSAAGTMVATKTIAIVVPSSAHIVRQPGTNIRHTQGKASVGFKGQIFLAPKDVSFVNIQFREGHAVGSATGFLAFKNGEIHNETPSWLPVGNGNSSTGCLAAIDTISTGDYSGPFSNGQFLWPIPWRQRVGSNPETVFMTANHQENVDPTGKATIQKAGSGPFSRALNDPTVTF